MNSNKYRLRNGRTDNLPLCDGMFSTRDGESKRILIFKFEDEPNENLIQINTNMVVEIYQNTTMSQQMNGRRKLSGFWRHFVALPYIILLQDFDQDSVVLQKAQVLRLQSKSLLFYCHIYLLCNFYLQRSFASHNAYKSSIVSICTLIKCNSKNFFVSITTIVHSLSDIAATFTPKLGGDLLEFIPLVKKKYFFSRSFLFTNQMISS